MDFSIPTESPLPRTAHTSHPWRIHELIPEFRLEDVWPLPTPGGPDDFPSLVAMIVSGDVSRSSSCLARSLFAIRSVLGKLFGWDGAGSEDATLLARVPADLRERRPAPSFRALPFTSLYLTKDEFAAELANRTMHGVLHLGWVSDGRGGYRGQMAILVKPNGVFGAAYMAAIRPFRHMIVYPALIKDWERVWRRRDTVRVREPSNATAAPADQIRQGG